MKIGLMLDDPEANRRQFAHGSAEGGHFALTAFAQSLVEGAHIGITAAGNDGGHITDVP